MSCDVYEFTDNRGNGAITIWRDGLPKTSKGKFEAKIRMLRSGGFDLPPKLLAGPLPKTQHIYKLIIHGDVMLRPMLCKGPFNMKKEATLLVGAEEVQWELRPDPQVAVENRAVLIRDPKRRVTYV